MSLQIVTKDRIRKMLRLTNDREIISDAKLLCQSTCAPVSRQ